ncbi:putative HAD-superfamily hydrolase [Vibrio nigripulchritudo MADA3029]|uniref:HAD-superfamily hydrolase n=1 Tax=Vibrio nigripulchritudo SOn1 TaxID=1238450 RepID=A0AAV2VWS7_9VIBR|nr:MULTISPECIES: HAD-IIB family hydrolase [Vibrio]UAB72279.1 HAD-IIB family hydrolase [Vibrio sp. SCSIO 43132]CCN49710.1 putative HAD-superfamily hydrolase [Vibrio nigripulchritudo MADA3020]CCN53999.1 putative HAD-superfamily hydrolase [Vibrio nigripulchritudo MADA3021]CCN57422.1 putative HAD-superfamily hydrolase [Vibrio nigripulchritudo MADA3029]CCO49060.1 putative HAD-superfamily hydrolase [Vibrio nigripulchritudo SOn1]
MNAKETNTYYEMTTPSLIFTDVDDTLTHNGELPVETLHALYRLREAGIEVVPVTGACAGWCDQIARLWPVQGVIGENGAFSITKNNGSIDFFDTVSDEDRRINRECLLKIVDRVTTEVPSLLPAKDNMYRRYDVAIDHGQDNSGVSKEDLDRAMTIIRSFGVSAAVSSVHINLWVGDYSKASGAMDWINTHKNWCEEELQLRCAFIGDSANDAAMFERFKHTVGVSNIQPFLPMLKHKPKQIMSLPGGYGFAEWANHVLDSRKVESW